MNNQRTTNPRLEHFTQLVREVEPFPLLEVAICVGHAEESELDVEKIMEAMANVTSMMKQVIEGRSSVFELADIVSRTLYGYYGFGGNIGTAYDSDQIYLHRVLQMGQGDSLSLGIVWLELARAVGVPASGTMVSDYFVVSVQPREGDWLVIDPLNGRLLDLPELEMMKTHQPYRGVEDAGRFLAKILVPATSQQIVGYLLQRLERIHATQRQYDKCIAVLDRAIVLEPGEWDAYRRRGIVHSDAKNTEAAISDLTTYLNNAGAGEHAEVALEMLQTLRRRG